MTAMDKHLYVTETEDDRIFFKAHCTFLFTTDKLYMRGNVLAFVLCVNGEIDFYAKKKEYRIIKIHILGVSINEIWTL